MGRGLPGFIRIRLLKKAPRRSPRTVPNAITKPPSSSRLSTGDSASPITEPAIIPANNPRTVLCAPRILSPSRKFRPPSSEAPPPKRRGAAFATYDGPMNNKADRTIPRLDRLDFESLLQPGTVMNQTLHVLQPNLPNSEQSPSTSNLSAIYLLEKTFSHIMSWSRAQP